MPNINTKAAQKLLVYLFITKITIKPEHVQNKVTSSFNKIIFTTELCVIIREWIYMF